MKKLLIIGLTTASAFAFSWSTFAGMFKKTIDSISYTVSTTGYNPRVYEFDTQGYPRMHCIAFFRSHSNTAPALQCVETNPKYIKANKKLEK